MQEKKCKKCGSEMKRYSYVNAGDSKELFKTIDGKTSLNVTQWKYICSNCKYSEIVPISESELKEIDAYFKKLKRVKK